MFKNYAYDGSIKQKVSEKNANKKDDDTSNKASCGYDEFENILQNKHNIISDDPDARYNEGISLGDPESADVRIVGLGHGQCGNSSLMLKLFYNEFDEEPEDNTLCQWEQHQMNYKYSDNNGDDDILRISYFDLKGFDDILSKSDMEDRIGNTINHSFNVILLYYCIDNRLSFEDSNGYSIQDIKLYIDYFLKLIDSKKFMLVLVALKLDLEKDGKRKVSKTEGINLSKEWKIPFIEVSAKTGENIQKLLDLICSIYTQRFEVIDGDLNEAAAFDEDKVTQRTIIKEDEEYDEYKEKEPEIMEDIMMITNDDGIDEDDDDDDLEQYGITTDDKINDNVYNVPDQVQDDNDLDVLDDGNNKKDEDIAPDYNEENDEEAPKKKKKKKSVKKQKESSPEPEAEEIKEDKLKKVTIDKNDDDSGSDIGDKHSDDDQGVFDLDVLDDANKKNEDITPKKKKKKKSVKKQKELTREIKEDKNRDSSESDIGDDDEDVFDLDTLDDVDVDKKKHATMIINDDYNDENVFDLDALDDDKNERAKNDDISPVYNEENEEEEIPKKQKKKNKKSVKKQKELSPEPEPEQIEENKPKKKKKKKKEKTAEPQQEINDDEEIDDDNKWNKKKKKKKVKKKKDSKKSKHAIYDEVKKVKYIPPDTVQSDDDNQHQLTQNHNDNDVEAEYDDTSPPKQDDNNDDYDDYDDYDDDNKSEPKYEPKSDDEMVIKQEDSPKSDKKPLFSTYVEPLQDKPPPNNTKEDEFDNNNYGDIEIIDDEDDMEPPLPRKQEEETKKRRKPKKREESVSTAPKEESKKRRKKKSKQKPKYEDESSPKTGQKPLFSTYTEPLQDKPPPTSKQDESDRNYGDIDINDDKPTINDNYYDYYDDDNKSEPKYIPNDDEPNYDNKSSPKSDKNPLISTYTEPLKDKPPTTTKQDESDDNDYNDDDDKKEEIKPEPIVNNYYSNDSERIKPRKPRPKNPGLSKKTMSVNEFKEVPLREVFENDDSLRDNFDIAKKICMFFDRQFGDKDTVCMVAESGKQPAISYWVKGDYVRKHKDIAGKHILVYRACKHRECKKPKVSQSKFEHYVKNISIEYENSSVDTICDLMDNKFGDGCHYARSTTKKPRYDIYSRFTDKYDAGFKLPSGAYIIAWRR